MTLLEIHLDEEHIVAVIKDFLCLDDKGEWIMNTGEGLLRVKFKGNYLKVQKAIHDWLSLPKRKSNFDQDGK